MKNWKNKTDYWPVALATMVGAMVAIACIDICTAWFGVEALARTLGLQ